MTSLATYVYHPSLLARPVFAFFQLNTRIFKMIISANGHLTARNGSGKRAIRIAGVSGGFSDRQRAIKDLAALDIDGDWLSECTMTLHGAQKIDNQKLRAEGKLMEEPVGQFDPTFMDTLSPALPDIARKGIKVAVNAGASDTKLLASLVAEEVKKTRTISSGCIC